MRLNDSTVNNTSHQTYSYQPSENLSDHYNALSNIPDIYTRLSLARQPSANDNGGELGLGSSGPQVGELQNALIDAGYNPGTPDEKFGNNTLAALQAYQGDRIDSLENSIREGVPPLARSELSRQVSELSSELNNNVAGSETLSQLNVGPVVDRPAGGLDEAEGLQRGDNGPAVESLQEDLNAAGYNSGTPDGDFGPMTEAAVQEFQQDRIDHLKGVQNGPVPPTDHAIIGLEISRLENELGSGVAGAETRGQLDRVLASRPIDVPPVERPAGPSGADGPVPLSGDPVSDERIALLHPEMQQRAAEFMNQVKEELGIQLRVTDGLRTFAEQDALFAEGPHRTGARGGQSYHNYGLAIDVVELIDDGRAVNYDTDYDAIAEIGEQYGFEWGGNFTSISDKPHFQYTNGLHWSELLERYNNNGNNPYVDLN